MTSQHSQRKNEHVSLAEKFFDNHSKSGFDNVRFIHQSLPEINLNEIDLSTNIQDLKLDFPFYIEAMTGGSDYTKKLNDKLSKVAKATGIAMATGSQSIALKDSSTVESFAVARKNYDGPIFANIGASHNLSDAKKVIKMVNADALEIHVNVAQELIMPEGERKFYWLDNIQNIVNNINIPVIVKEVGFGMAKETIQKLKSIGVKNINISGRGGTNFATIENFRRHNKELNYLSTWGQTTVESLLEAYSFSSDLSIISSGGIRNPLDIAKSIALGSNAVGMSGFILNSVIKNGIEETINQINEFKNGLKIIMTLLSCRTIYELQQKKLVLDSKLVAYLQQRSLSY
ncbi:type 2 isopentenyl-diphosphate Delta-isomerase [Apilactobacillus timberlakei]|uniref:type 2 isopentenyl-diphosphate Delta-isomerase n=1 Tax=Apilactobacillus timberlakei TaxID=2008380 RepID=UPI0011292EE4|nr:type 2 isopentenyl-diphosphate Delta-isomerase [Apilactobacillus timberlakei]TPR24066.1 type 2 isopentenyl-diphosphate Delta-isomerase [Apilactobacillus timberlakei]